MKLACALAGIAFAMSTARAEPQVSTEPPADVMQRIRQLSEQKDYAGMRRELLAAYETTHHAPLLFALGQVEYNLRAWQAAIDYYEQFIATSPPEAEVSLAQQGIVAARTEMQRDAERPLPPPPPKPRRRAWTRSDTIFAVASGGAAVLGFAAFAYGNHIGNDQSGSLADYDSRAERARIFQYAGAGLVAAGIVTAGITVLRWRLRPDDGEVTVTATGSGAQVSVTW
jgi:tetratricopeptide (TPR) repeat protein